MNLSPSIVLRLDHDHVFPRNTRWTTGRRRRSRRWRLRSRSGGHPWRARRRRPSDIVRAALSPGHARSRQSARPPPPPPSSPPHSRPPLPARSAPTLIVPTCTKGSSLTDGRFARRCWLLSVSDFWGGRVAGGSSLPKRWARERDLRVSIHVHQPTHSQDLRKKACTKAS